MGRKLPGELYLRCRKGLLKCSEFDNDASLRSAFVTDELSSFRDSLPQGSTRTERVDITLDYLVRKHLSDGRPLLPVFLAALRDKYSANDSLHGELNALIPLVQSALSLPSNKSDPQLQALSHPEGDGFVDIELAHPSLQKLLAVVGDMVSSGDITSNQQAYLNQLFRQVEPEAPSSGAEAIEWLKTATISQEISVETRSHQQFIVVLEGYVRQCIGEIPMIDKSAPISYVAQIFSRTAHLLAHELSTLAEHQSVWPELIIGDEITQQSIDSLYNMQTQIGLVSNLLDKFIPDHALRRFQMERDGFMESSKKLRILFEDLDGYLIAGTPPRDIINEMERQLDDLLYYANRCLLWLNDLAQSAAKTTALPES